MLRRIPWWVVLFFFIVVPLVEIYVIIQIGQVIGAWWTILLLIADSIFGTWLIRREGSKAWRALRTALEQGRMPSTELADGALILVGGTLMLTPGFVTDAFGMACILPFTRPLARRALAAVVGRKLADLPIPGSRPGGASRADRAQNDTRPGPTDVVQGEIVD